MKRVLDNNDVFGSTPTLQAPLATRHAVMQKARKLMRNNKLVAAASIYLTLVIIISLCAQWLPLQDPNKGNLMDSLLPPAFSEGGSTDHWLGTDKQGRDILSRIIYGARLSLGIALFATVLSMVSGILIGLLSGYFKRMDQIFMRIADIELAFPPIVLAIALVVALGGASVLNLVIVLSIAGWIEYSRVVRSQVLSLKESTLVEATISLGANNIRILFIHILPNVVASAVALATVQLPMFMIQEAGLSFLGLGAPLDTPSWGGMLKEGQQLIYNAWWPIVLPTIAITTVVFSGVIVGDWITRRFEKA
jgi:peptide/nickel transport system permease protein